MFVNLFKVLLVCFFTACLFLEKAVADLPPPESYWNLSVEKIVNAGFLEEGGSDIFRYYIQHSLNNIDATLQTTTDTEEKAAAKHLCRESDCSKGLDLKRIDKPAIHAIIEYLAYKPFTVSSSNAPNTETVIFLQSDLGPGLEEKEAQTPQNPEEHIENIKNAIAHMKARNVKRIVVNLAPQDHSDLRPFFLLGQFIFENQVELHIAGKCGSYCARYLIPAAKTVYMEPYGHIYFSGSFKGLFSEVQKSILPQQKIYIKNWEKMWLPQLKDKVGFITSSLQNLLNSNPNMMLQKVINFIVVLKKFDLKAGTEFENILQDSLSRDINLFTDLQAEKIRKFLKSFSSESLNSLAFFFKLKTADQISLRYLRKLYDLQTKENTYYVEGINISRLPFQNHYSYINLLELAAWLGKNSEYEKYFAVPRLYYNIPEKNKPYLKIIPSADLLRSTGLQIIGENNPKMAGLTDNNSREEPFLYLDNKRIESCKFFEKGASYTTETLQDCLFE